MARIGRSQPIQAHYQRALWLALYGTSYSYLYPISDVADGGWLNELATATNLYASVDEVAVDDADYVIAPLTASADTVKFGLTSAGGTPGAGTVSLIIRHKKV